MERIRTITLAVAALLALPAVAQRQWTLQECIDYAMEHNISLQQKKIEQRSAAEDVKYSRAEMLPSLSASTNQSVGYRPWEDSGQMTVTNGYVNSKVDKSYYNGSYGINASWTVWNGGRNTNTIRLNELTEQQAELDAATTANSIQEQIARLYVQVLYLREAITVAEATLQTSRKNEDRGQEMLNVGKMSKADLAQLASQRATDEYSLVEAQTQLASYMQQLRQVLQLTTDADFDVADPAVDDQQALSDIPSLRSVYEAALLSRPEIARAQLALKSSDVQMKIARAGWLPTVSMTGGLGTSTNSMSSTGWGSQMKTNFDASAGVTISLPIFDNRSTRTSVNKARLQQENYQLALDDLETTLYQTIENYWLDATTNQQKYRAATATVESEQQSYGLLSEQFNLGLKNIVELMTGKDRLLTAQQNQLQSKYLTILNLQMLKFYSGAK